MRAAIVTIGNELMLGRTVDTNAAWLSRRLDELGFEIAMKVSVGDDPAAMRSVIKDALESVTLVVTTGGLGPTHDDVTKRAIADVFDVDLVLDEALEASLAERYQRRERRFTEERRTMALVPDGFDWLHNPVGSAPGLVGRPLDLQPRCLIALPGVPYEMEAIVEEHFENVLAHLKRGAAAHRTFRTAGVTEGRLQSLLSDVVNELEDDRSIAFLPDPKNGVAARLSVRSETQGDAKSKLDDTAGRIESAVGDHVYGGEGDRLEAVLGDRLRAAGKTVSLAESCTGGLIGDRLTDVPGSSDYFKGSLVTYDNRAKIELLGVSPETIGEYGAVSEEVAVEMARGCRIRFQSDLAISATGIAGPGGGTAEKPVGTVWLGFADADQSTALRLRLTDNRRLNKMLASTAALNMLFRKLYV